MPASLHTQQVLFMQKITQLLVFLGKEGLGVVGRDLMRSTDRLPCPSCKKEVSYQELLLSAKKTKTLFSKHCDCLALDLMIFPETDENYRKAGEFWEKLGGRWGGRFGLEVGEYKIKIGWDRYHFEL